jgi:transcriptional regulator with XRE-family HTH domain
MKQRSPKQVKKSFGDAVCRLRKERGLSQEGLALASGMDRSYIGGVERGERNISLFNIVGLSHALGVKASYLLEGVE